MKKGYIIYNDYWTSDNVDYCIDKFISNVNRHKGLEIELLSGRKIALNTTYYIEKRPDFVIMRDKSPIIAKAFEFYNIPAFNSSETIRICDDKAIMSQILQQKGIKRPETIISPETYNKPIGLEFINQVADILGFPLVIKKTKSSHGIGVSMARSYKELANYKDCIEPLVFERYVPVPFGQDIRVFIVGEQIIGVMKRKSITGDFRSNIELGGKGYKTAITNDIKLLAQTAAKAVKADYCGVDIINGDEPKVIEVNCNPGFRCMDEINSIDTASYVLDYIMEKIK